MRNTTVMERGNEASVAVAAGPGTPLRPRFNSSLLLVLSATCLLISIPQRLVALTLPRLSQTWKYPAYHADLMGVMECTVAGVETADYRVLVPWFGCRKGDVLRISGQLATVGDQTLIAAERRPPDPPPWLDLPSFDSGHSASPFSWWRLESNLHLLELPVLHADEAAVREALNSAETDPRSRRELQQQLRAIRNLRPYEMDSHQRRFRRRVLAFRARPRAVQEADMLRADMELSYLLFDGASLPAPSQILSTVGDPGALLNAALDQSAARSWGSEVPSILSFARFRAGGVHALQAMLNKPWQDYPASETGFGPPRDVIHTILRRLSDEEYQQIDFYPFTEAEELDTLKALLQRSIHLHLPSEAVRNAAAFQSVAELMEFVWRVGFSGDVKVGHATLRFFEFGGPATLSFLKEKLSTLDANGQAALIPTVNRLEVRLGLRRLPPNDPGPWTQDEILQVERWLTGDEAVPDGFFDPIHHLTAAVRMLGESHPDAVFRFLIDFDESEHVRRDPRGRPDVSYDMGPVYTSYLAANHRLEDLHGQLWVLTAANDPGIRVAAAAHLAFLDPENAIQALSEMTSLPGEAGAWAAMELVRRGNTAAMPRALEVFNRPATSGLGPIDTQTQTRYQGSLRGALQRRLRTLVSNIAAQNGLFQPMPDSYHPRTPGGQQLPATITDWWATHQDRIQDTTDPWLDELEAIAADRIR